MPTSTQDRIKSETRWIQMHAARYEASELKDPERRWYLVIYINGTHLEFCACEGNILLFTADEALHRIKEFESTMNAENQNYVQSLMGKAINLLTQK